MKHLKLGLGLAAAGDCRTVYELIERLRAGALRGEYSGIMRLMRALICDIKKNRTDYPADIETLRDFVLFQLRSNIEHSAACAEPGVKEFRRLAEHAVLTEVMQDIYMADCKASRTAAYMRLNKKRGAA